MILVYFMLLYTYLKKHFQCKKSTRFNTQLCKTPKKNKTKIATENINAEIHQPLQELEMANQVMQHNKLKVVLLDIQLL